MVPIWRHFFLISPFEHNQLNCTPYSPQYACSCRLADEQVLSIWGDSDAIGKVEPLCCHPHCPVKRVVVQQPPVSTPFKEFHPVGGAVKFAARVREEDTPVGENGHVIGQFHREYAFPRVVGINKSLDLA